MNKKQWKTVIKPNFFVWSESESQTSSAQKREVMWGFFVWFGFVFNFTQFKIG